MNITIEKLTFALIEECEPLLSDNYKETGHLTESLDINWNAYLALGDAFVAFALRDSNNKLEGVLFFLVSPYSHIQSLIIAQQITFFINLKHRFFANHMLNLSEEHFADRGVDLIIQSARYGSKFEHLLTKKGYVATDVQFIKRLT